MNERCNLVSGQRLLPSFRFVQGIEILAQRGDDTFVFIRILAEDILEGHTIAFGSISNKTECRYFDHHDCFLDHVIDFRLNQIDQGADTSLGRLFDFDGASTDRPDRLPNEINIDLSGISKATQWGSSSNLACRTLSIPPRLERCSSHWSDGSWCPVSPVWHRWDRCTWRRRPSFHSLEYPD